MAVIVEWRGIRMPPSVREALTTPWRGQPSLRGTAARAVLAFFTDQPKFTNQTELGAVAAAPESLSPQKNVKSILRLKAEGDSGRAHVFSYQRINPSKLLDDDQHHLLRRCGLLRRLVRPELRRLGQSHPPISRVVREVSFSQFGGPSGYATWLHAPGCTRARHHP